MDLVFILIPKGVIGYFWAHGKHYATNKYTNTHSSVFGPQANPAAHSLQFNSVIFWTMYLCVANLSIIIANNYVVHNSY